jgi:ATP-dependent Clp protease ATP-binding subunit ClpC
MPPWFDTCPRGKYNEPANKILSMIPEHAFEKLSSHARNTLTQAEHIARSSGEKTVLPKHLLLAILLEEGAFGSLFFKNAGLAREAVGEHCFPGGRDRIIQADSDQHPRSGQKTTRKRTARIPLSEGAKAVLTQAYFIASDFRSPYVGTEHLAYSLIENPGAELGNILAASGIDSDKTLDSLESHLEPDHFPNFGRLLDLPDLSLARPDEPSGGDTPVLSQYTVDLALDAKRRDESFFGRGQEIDRVVRILGRKEKNNPLLLGDPGVGKTAIVSALARKIAEGDAPASVLGKRILALDLAQIVAGTSFRGEFEARLKDIVSEAKEHPDIILFIDELHTLVGAGNTQGGLDAANILKPALARGEIRVIGATTRTEFKKHIEKDPALSRRFQPVSVHEPSAEETRALLRHIRPSYERFHKVSIPTDLLDLSVTLGVRHLPDRFLPDKAIDILDEASSLAKSRRAVDHAGRAALAVETALRNLAEEKSTLVHDGRIDEAALLLDDEKRLREELEEMKKRSRNVADTASVRLDQRDLLETVSAMTGIPFATLESETPAERLRKLGTNLRRSVAHQEEAIARIENVLARAASGVRDPEKPLGSFLFLGPSGVGKTFLTKTVAREFFGGEDRLIRLDMSEFMERHSVAGMIGAPAGYVGFGEGGRLTERIRKTPHAVVLFDEIEKAHPDVWNVLLQILDEGALTDAEGTRVSFRNTLVVLTSNLGTEAFRTGGKIGFSRKSGASSHPENVREAVLEEVKKTLRPELSARIDHTIVFNPLDRSAMEKITRLELGTLKKRLAAQGVRLFAPRPVVRFLAERSLSEDHGARLVRKRIEELVDLPVAKALISRGFNPESPKGRIRITLSVSRDGIACDISEEAKDRMRA